MKILKRLTQISTLFILSFVLPLISFSQCSLSNLSVEASVCTVDDLVNLIIDFDFTGEGNQGFTILGNGANYGNFEYTSLPVTLSDIEANCDTEYEFIIRDIQDPTCSVFTEYGTICCADACNIEILSVSASDCIDEEFSLTVETSPLSAGTLVNVSINGEVITQIELDALPFILEDITVDQIGINTISICSALDLDCCSTIQFLNPCECATSNITAEIVDCSEVDSSYFAIIDFEYAATSDSFQMGYSDGNDNNFLGVFAYSDLPITAGPIFWSDNEREMLIVDKGDFFCFNTAFLGVVNDCDINCQVFNVFAESYECADGEYFIDVEFDTEDIQGSTFDVIVDDINYGSFIYGESLYSVGPINQNCDSAPIVVIQDSGMEGCNDFFIFDEPICCGVLCEFSIFEATAICNDAEEVVISFEYDNPSTTPNNQFFVTFGEMVYGPYPGPSGEGEFSLSLLADGVYNLSIYVDNNESCFAETPVIVLCPMEECLITEVFAEARDCIDGQFLVDIAFNTSAVSDSFELRGNGQLYGVFSYGDTLYTIGPLQGDCETIYEFVVIDQDENNCQDAYVFNGPICCQVCEFSIFEATAICNDAEEVVISFEYDNPSTTPNNQFFVTFGEMVYGPYPGPSGEGEFSLSLLADGVYNLSIYVADNKSCFAETPVVVLCPMEECLITEVFAEARDCIDDQFLVDIAFSTSAVSDSFELRGNGQLYGVFSYGDTLYTIGPLQGDCETIYEFVVIDQDENNCQGAYVFNGPVCCQICEYGEMDIALIDCIDDQYTISIDFLYADSGTSFELSFLGEIFTYDYSQLPVEIDNLPVNTEIEITASNISDKECTTSGVSFLENCYDTVTEDEINALVISQNQTIITTFNPTNKEFGIYLTSISGKVLEKGIIKANAKIDFMKDALSNGLYFISLEFEGIIKTKKIVITDSNN